MVGSRIYQDSAIDLEESGGVEIQRATLRRKSGAASQVGYSGSSPVVNATLTERSACSSSEAC